MTEFLIETVSLDDRVKHPNADSLTIVNVNQGYPCIIRTEDFATISTGTYVPVDSLVPVDRPEFSFLAGSSANVKRDGKEYARVKARRLRGVFSMGILLPATYGDDPQTALGILKYETPEELTASAVPQYRTLPAETSPWLVYGSAVIMSGLAAWELTTTGAIIFAVLALCAAAWTTRPRRGRMAPRVAGPSLTTYDLEALRRHKGALKEGEIVSLTEKIHGCNARFVYTKGKFFVGSRNQWRGNDGSVWRTVAAAYGLEKICKANPNKVVYGEIYGKVQDLKYGVPDGQVRFAAFDVFDITTNTFLPVTEFRAFCASEGLPVVPEIFQGPWSPDLVKHAEGKSTLPSADHVREGCVIKPIDEYFVPGLNRTVLKHIGEGYQTRQ